MTELDVSRCPCSVFTVHFSLNASAAVSKASSKMFSKNTVEQTFLFFPESVEEKHVPFICFLLFLFLCGKVFVFSINVFTFALSVCLDVFVTRWEYVSK